MKLSRATKQEKAAAILETYLISSAINRCVGNELTEEYEQNQHNIAESEFKETMLAIENNDLEQLHDGLGDLLVTVSECLMIQDRDTYLLKNLPHYINTEEKPVEELVYEAYRFFRERNYIDALGLIEDAVDAVEGDIISYLHAINLSNLSKFPKVGTVDPEVECDKIEAQGRYTDVYFEEGELRGERVYVFKSKYDSKNKERFPKGKYLKPSTFREPQEFLCQN
jgi:hypothetical protein